MNRLTMGLLLGSIAVSAGSVSAGAADSTPVAYGQVLVTRIAKDHPEIRKLVLHAATQNGGDNVIIASTTPADLGEKSDASDLAVLNTGKTVSSVTKASDAVEILLPLHDVSNETVGVLAVIYPFHAGLDTAALERGATRIRDDLHRHISHAANLAEPEPFLPGVTPGNYAQKLADDVLAKYPDVEVFMIHATPPGSSYNVVAGSSIGRIGEYADNDDMRVEFTGKPNLEVNTSGNRFESELRLRDRTGRTIGAVGFVFAYKKGDSKDALHARSEMIKAEVEKQIPDSDSLFKSAS